MRKNINKVHLEGRIYQLGNSERNRLSIKTVTNTSSANYGKPYISGELDIATDEECLNIVSVHFTYVTPTFASGKVNNTFNILKNIIENEKSVMTVGKEEAYFVKVDGQIGLNEFISSTDNRLVSAKRVEGSFVTMATATTLTSMDKAGETVNPRNDFVVDMFATKAQLVEPETGSTYLNLGGVIFDFKNRIMPVEFRIVNPAAIDAIMGMEISPSNPYYTQIKHGCIVNSEVTVMTEVNTIFGVHTEPTTKRERAWIITQVSEEPYAVGTEDTITAEELAKAAQDRALVEAEIKKRNDEYLASKAAPSTTTSQAQAQASMPAPNSGAVKFGSFNF